MMMSEFIDRTGYTPSMEEYGYIEESYYDFPGNKDEFCKAWLKDKRDGHWEREMMLRKKLVDQDKANAAKIAEMEENLNFYRPYFDRSREYAKQLEDANSKLERLQRVFKRVFDNEQTA